MTLVIFAKGMAACYFATTCSIGALLQKSGRRRLIMPGRLAIAIVDDNEPLTRSIAKVLASRQLEVEVFHTGESFLHQASRIKEFGCILLDLRLPDLGGLEILSAIQDLADCPSVLILTGHGDVPVAVEAMKMGVVDFMQKPFSNETLLEAVERATAATERARDSELSRDQGPVEREPR